MTQHTIFEYSTGNLATPLCAEYNFPASGLDSEIMNFEVLYGVYNLLC